MATTIGKVRWFSAPLGYGFIEQDDGTSVYVHYTALPNDERERLRAGKRVEFDVDQTARGPQAVHVLPA